MLGADLTHFLPLASEHQDIGESLPVLVKLLEMIAQQGGILNLMCEANEQGERRWSAAMQWDREAPDSDMAGAACYAPDMVTLTEVTDHMAAEIGLSNYATTMPPLGTEFQPRPTESESTDEPADA